MSKIEIRSNEDAIAWLQSMRDGAYEKVKHIEKTRTYRTDYAPMFWTIDCLIRVLKEATDGE